MTESSSLAHMYFMEYGLPNIKVERTETFDNWLQNLRDRRAAARIASRITRVEDGNFGDIKPVGEGVGEMRIDYGPGYRLYLMLRGPVVVVLLCGGDKSTQTRDIIDAKRIAKVWKE